jgi:hypothetical protein
MITKRNLLDIGMKDVFEFCEVNGITPPKTFVKDDYGSPCGVFYYRSKTIRMHLKSCANAAVVPGRYCWSFPCYFVNRTPHGVLIHEFGHYVHDLLKYPKLPAEVPITSYEPNLDERFAETMKVFVCNPNLLEEANPQRYAALIKLGLKPSVKLSWREVLANAHPKYVTACENRIKRTKKLH